MAGGIAALLLPLVVPAAAPAAEVRYAAGFFSHYVWRGITLTDGPVFQPSVRISHASGFAFEAWGNVDLDDDNDAAAEFSETRLTFDYGRRLGDFEIGAGLVEYLFPNTPFPGTRELYVRLDLRLQTGWTEPLDPDVLPDQETSFWAGATVAFRL